MPAPEAKIDSFSQNGQVRITFSEEMLMKESLEGFFFKSKSQNDHIDDEDDSLLRNLKVIKEVNLESIL